MNFIVNRTFYQQFLWDWESSINNNIYQKKLPSVSRGLAVIITRLGQNSLASTLDLTNNTSLDFC